jgi:hypothetical protein
MDQIKDAFMNVIAEVNENMLIADGFDEAIIGYVERLGGSGYETFVLYDKEKVVEILQNDMTREEALDYFEFNILGAYMGEHTPAYATVLNLEGEQCT